jgi:ABC-2 type transport system ATP-binding protein
MRLKGLDPSTFCMARHPESAAGRSLRAFIGLSSGARRLRRMAAQTTYPAGERGPVVPAAEAPVVRARGLVKRYGEIVAVDHVDLAVPAGAVYGLLGPNGAGKTTFMRMLFGLIRPDEGSVELFGRAEVAGRVEALEDVAGFVEAPRFYPYLSGRANLEVLATLDRRAGAGERIPELLEQVELSDRAHSKVREYSYGMVQRLGVAAALMRAPRLLVLDEPTNGLDPAGIRDMRRLIARLASTGITILLSSHNMLEVEEICQHVAIMRRGRIAFDGPMVELRSLAQDVEYHLVTNDDARAANVCRTIDGIASVRTGRDGIRFDSRPEPVERLTKELGRMDIGIRRLELPVTALETLFFRLTESDGHSAVDAR